MSYQEEMVSAVGNGISGRCISLSLLLLVNECEVEGK